MNECLVSNPLSLSPLSLPPTHPPNPPTHPTFPTHKAGGRPYGILGQGHSPDAIICKMPMRAIGQLMGSGGARIKEIREKTGARMALARPGETEMGSTETYLVIDGTPDVIQAAREMVKETVYQWKMQASKERAEKALALAAGEELGLDGRPANAEEEEEVTIKFSMPTPLMGHVIGKGGDFIKALHATGVLVKILQEERSFTRMYDERPVMLTGPLATVLAVQQQLLDRMATAPPKSVDMIKALPPRAPEPLFPGQGQAHPGALPPPTASAGIGYGQYPPQQQPGQSAAGTGGLYSGFVPQAPAPAPGYPPQQQQVQYPGYPQLPPQQQQQQAYYSYPPQQQQQQAPAPGASPYGYPPQQQQQQPPQQAPAPAPWAGYAAAYPTQSYQQQPQAPAPAPAQAFAPPPPPPPPAPPSAPVDSSVQQLMTLLHLPHSVASNIDPATAQQMLRAYHHEKGGGGGGGGGAGQGQAQRPPLTATPPPPGLPPPPPQQAAYGGPWDPQPQQQQQQHPPQGGGWRR